MREADDAEIQGNVPAVRGDVKMLLGYVGGKAITKTWVKKIDTRSRELDRSMPCSRRRSIWNYVPPCAP